MSTPKPQKHHSRLLNLLLMAALLWGAFTLSATSHYPPAIKMFAAYVSWGMMIYLLMGVLFRAQTVKYHCVARRDRSTWRRVGTF